MNRPAPRLASVPAPTVDEAKVKKKVKDVIAESRRLLEQQRCITVEELATHFTTTRHQVDRWVELGMPAFNIADPKPGRRQKRCLRFDVAACEAWLHRRHGAA